MKAFGPVLLLYVCPALLLWCAPGIHDAFLYDRAAILHGAGWRLWTGHWVHFSPSHLFWNLAVLLGAGVWLERLLPGWLLRYTLIAAPLISLALLLGEPAMHFYGGLSGLATGVVVGLALGQIRLRGDDRAGWSVLLALVGAKMVLDILHANPLFSRFDALAVRSSGLSHMVGAAVALAFFLSRQTLFCIPLFRVPRSAPPRPQSR